MKWRVRWLKKAVNELAVVWNQASSEERKAITKASHELEKQLEATPLQEGESRDRGRRVMFAAPLCIVFHVNKKNQTVVVLEIRLYRPGKK